MASDKDFVRFLASWALVHETADEGWKAAVVRGEEMAPGDMDAGPEAFVDGLSAMVAIEKDRLKTRLASGTYDSESGTADVSASVDELRFEVSELRGRMESLQATLDALVVRLDTRA